MPTRGAEPAPPPRSLLAWISLALIAAAVAVQLALLVLGLSAAGGQPWALARVQAMGQISAAPLLSLVNLLVLVGTLLALVHGVRLLIQGARAGQMAWLAVPFLALALLPTVVTHTVRTAAQQVETRQIVEDDLKALQGRGRTGDPVPPLEQGDLFAGNPVNRIFRETLCVSKNADWVRGCQARVREIGALYAQADPATGEGLSTADCRALVQANFARMDEGELRREAAGGAPTISPAGRKLRQRDTLQKCEQFDDAAATRFFDAASARLNERLARVRSGAELGADERQGALRDFSDAARFGPRAPSRHAEYLKRAEEVMQRISSPAVPEAARPPAVAR
ncbi:hypothetical protein [Ottowia testudinis]|uniref:Uncharacterized protein n=1 Tax=Ottowia testudinis TaxID=2816950 RepID=A0A975CKW5_9BURK|nr:hypothetical protein [Ottowia testudinis]QTD46079.1 hypothetical protein J1M35_03980 [Ottowia testudinis]